MDVQAALLKDVWKSPRLSREEQIVLARRYKDTGDMKAREQCILSIWPWGLRLARRYSEFCGVDFLELASVAAVGMIEAVDSFDPSRNLSLVTWATWHIRKELLIFTKQHAHIIDLPQHVWAETSGECHDKAMRVREGVKQIDEQYPVADRTDDERKADDDEETEYRLALVRQALSHLSERDRRVVLGRMDGKLLRVIGDELGYTRERIRQIEKQAIGELRKNLAWVA
jgi:RNA polymerase primary sigma factor